jgi:hypothetical protein
MQSEYKVRLHLGWVWQSSPRTSISWERGVRGWTTVFTLWIFGFVIFGQRRRYLRLKTVGDEICLPLDIVNLDQFRQNLAQVLPAQHPLRKLIPEMDAIEIRKRK